MAHCMHYANHMNMHITVGLSTCAYVMYKGGDGTHTGAGAWGWECKGRPFAWRTGAGCVQSLSQCAHGWEGQKDTWIRQFLSARFNNIRKDTYCTFNMLNLPIGLYYVHHHLRCLKLFTTHELGIYVWCHQNWDIRKMSLKLQLSLSLLLDSNSMC